MFPCVKAKLTDTYLNDFLREPTGSLTVFGGTFGEALFYFLRRVIVFFENKIVYFFFGGGKVINIVPYAAYCFAG